MKPDLFTVDYDHPRFAVYKNEAGQAFIDLKYGGQGAVILPILANGKIVLTHEIRPTPAGYKYVWALPKGGRKEAEELCETAKRELFEETGYQIEITQFKFLGAMSPSTALTLSTLNYFVAFLGYAQPKVGFEKGQYEVLEAKSFTIEEINKMALTGNLIDGYVFTALGLWNAHREIYGHPFNGMINTEVEISSKQITTEKIGSLLNQGFEIIKSNADTTKLIKPVPMSEARTSSSKLGTGEVIYPKVFSDKNKKD